MSIHRYLKNIQVHMKQPVFFLIFSLLHADATTDNELEMNSKIWTKYKVLTFIDETLTNQESVKYQQHTYFSVICWWMSMSPSPRLISPLSATTTQYVAVLCSRSLATALVFLQEKQQEKVNKHVDMKLFFQASSGLMPTYHMFTVVKHCVAVWISSGSWD